MASQSLSPLGSFDLFPLQTEINKLFSDFGFGAPGASRPQLTPRMDVIERDKEIVITAELPGLEEKDVDISFSDGVLSIRGEKKVEKEEKNETKHVYERSYGSFSRSIVMPDGLKPSDVKAVLDKGVLTVTLPKPEAPKIEVQKIPVQKVS